MFSIIIPTFNRNQQLLTALNQIEKQSFREFEVIIIDDASEDKYEINEGLYSFNINYYRQSINTGPAGARNLGVRLANYNWILFLDDDDLFHSNKLMVLNNYIINNDVDFVYHKACIHMVNEGVSYITSQSDIKYITDSPQQQILKGNFIGGPPNFAIKKDIFNRLNGFSQGIRAIEDYEFLIRMVNIIDKKRFLFINEVLTSCFYTTKVVSVSKNIDNLNSACNYINSHHINENDKSKHNFELSKALMMAHSSLMNLKRISSYYYMKAGFLDFSLKYLASGIVCLISPVLLIKIRGGFNNDD